MTKVKSSNRGGGETKHSYYRWKVEGGLLALLAVASIAASSFSLFGNNNYYYEYSAVSLESDGLLRYQYNSDNYNDNSVGDHQHEQEEEEEEEPTTTSSNKQELNRRIVPESSPDTVFTSTERDGGDRFDEYKNKEVVKSEEATSESLAATDTDTNTDTTQATMSTASRKEEGRRMMMLDTPDTDNNNDNNNNHHQPGKSKESDSDSEATKLDAASAKTATTTTTTTTTGSDTTISTGFDTNTTTAITTNSSDGIQEGLRSNKSWEFFQQIRDEIDKIPWQERCQRSGSYRRIFGRDYARSYMPANKSQRALHAQLDSVPLNKTRRIFWGSLISDEPWELFEIMGAETYGIFEGMVFVESNRTQTNYARPLRWVGNQAAKQRLQRIFGISQIEIRQFVNEDDKLYGLTRENEQRHEILVGWKEMGMQPNDVGYISDVDESFSRDFLRAIQTCPYVAPFDYDALKCHLKGRILGRTKVYEGSPHCLTKDRTWDHPDMILGACIEVIGNATEHPWAKRHGFRRIKGYATGHGHEAPNTTAYQTNYANIKDRHFPLWSAGDFRMQGGGYQVTEAGFHLHNWFANFDKIRNKYKTYGHPVKNALTIPIQDIHSDLKLMVYCLKNLTDAPKKKHQPPPKNKEGTTKGSTRQWTETQDHHRLIGDFESFPKPWPIYFWDEEYRQLKHQSAQVRLEEDQEKRLEMLQPYERNYTLLKEHILEIKRQAWDIQTRGKYSQYLARMRDARDMEKELRQLKRESQSASQATAGAAADKK